MAETPKNTRKNGENDGKIGIGRIFFARTGVFVKHFAKNPVL
jgi:hypothetical protein